MAAPSLLLVLPVLCASFSCLFFSVALTPSTQFRHVCMCVCVQVHVSLQSGPALAPFSSI